MLCVPPSFSDFEGSISFNWLGQYEKNNTKSYLEKWDSVGWTSRPHSEHTARQRTPACQESSQVKWLNTCTVYAFIDQRSKRNNSLSPQTC